MRNRIKRSLLVCTAIAAMGLGLGILGCGGGGGGHSGGGLGSVIGSGVGIATGGNPFQSSKPDAVTLGIKGAGIVKNFAESQAISEDRERKLGQSVAVETAKRWGVAKDDQLNVYVMMVAQALTDATPAGGRPVAFVLDSPTYVNAFSGPQGYVMVTKALVARMDDESELAGVIAHEVGHVAEQHGTKSIKDAGTRKLIFDTATITTDNQLTDMMKGFAEDATSSIHDQAQEREADADAVRLMYAAGYDPMGYVRILQKLAVDQRPGGNVFTTHPDINSRIAAITDQINKENLRGGQTNRERFQAMTAALRAR